MKQGKSRDAEETESTTNPVARWNREHPSDGYLRAGFAIVSVNGCERSDDMLVELRSSVTLKCLGFDQKRKGLWWVWGRLP